MDGTVICANRAEGLVARAGSAPKVAASGRGGMARGNAGPAGAFALTGAALGFVPALLAAGLTDGVALVTGTAFFATGLATLAATFFAGTLAAGLAAGFFAAVLGATALLTGAFFAAPFAAGLTALGAGFAGFALAAGLPALGWGFTSSLRWATALPWDCCATADFP